MAITTSPVSLKNQMDKAPPGQLADYFRTIKIGTFLRQSKTLLMGKVPALNSYQLSTVLEVPTAEDAPAARILSAYARVATTGTGPYTEAVPGATPTTTQIAVAPNGRIVTLGTDAATLVDVLYEPAIGDVIEFTGTLATGLLALPAAITARGVIYLLEAEILTGTVTGKKIVLIPADGLPATTKAQLKLLKDVVQFNNATDAGITARVKLFVAPAADRDAQLTAAQTF